jgi:hypothetical protein
VWKHKIPFEVNFGRDFVFTQISLIEKKTTVIDDNYLKPFLA